ncbi:MAG: hypothetical protein SGPRY_002697, partial [Prymnesium sp.]
NAEGMRLALLALAAGAGGDERCRSEACCEALARREHAKQQACATASPPALPTSDTRSSALQLAVVVADFHPANGSNLEGTSPMELTENMLHSVCMMSHAAERYDIFLFTTQEQEYAVQPGEDMVLRLEASQCIRRVHLRSFSLPWVLHLANRFLPERMIRKDTRQNGCRVGCCGDCNLVQWSKLFLPLLFAADEADSQLLVLDYDMVAVRPLRPIWQIPVGKCGPWLATNGVTATGLTSALLLFNLHAARRWLSPDNDESRDFIMNAVAMASPESWKWCFNHNMAPLTFYFSLWISLPNLGIHGVTKTWSS